MFGAQFFSAQTDTNNDTDTNVAALVTNGISVLHPYLGWMFDKFSSEVKNQGPYSQLFIFIVIYKQANKLEWLFLTSFSSLV
jgi:hypothetical protein